MTKQELKQILNNFKIYYNIRDLFYMNDDEIEKHLLNLLQDHADAYNAFYDTLDKHEQQSISAMLDALDNAIDKLDQGNESQNYDDLIECDRIHESYENKIVHKDLKTIINHFDLDPIHLQDLKQGDVDDLIEHFNDNNNAKSFLLIIHQIDYKTYKNELEQGDH